MNKIAAILLTIITCNLQAQDSHFGLSMGAALPFNELAADDAVFESGYAGTGFHISFDGNYIPTWYFGVGGSLNLSTFPTDADKMRADLKERISTLPPVEIPDNAKYELGIGNWSYVNMMVGPTIALPAGSFQFNGKAFIGMCIAMPPSNEFTVTYGDNEFMSYNNPQTLAFAYSLGTDIIYNFSGTYSVKLGAEYFGSQSNNTYTFEYVNSSQDQVEIPSIDSNIKISAAHVYLGMAFLF